MDRSRRSRFQRDAENAWPADQSVARCVRRRLRDVIAGAVQGQRARLFTAAPSGRPRGISLHPEPSARRVRFARVSALREWECAYSHNFGIAWDLGVFATNARYRTESGNYERAAAFGIVRGIEWVGSIRSMFEAGFQFV